MQIRPTGLVCYEYVQWLIPHARKPKENISKEFKERLTYSGEMTEGSRKRLKRHIQTLIAISQPKRVVSPGSGLPFTFRINFLTLTLPAPQGKLTDRDIRSKCLEPFLRRMRNKYNVKNYIWKAERQLNGNIHYHITADQWILYSDLQNEWNNQMEKVGLIDAFQAKHGHRHPNSTDVHSVKSIKNLAGYLIKYMAKEHKPKITKPQCDPTSKIPHKDTKRKALLKTLALLSGNLKPIQGKLWDCSENLKKATRLEFEITGEENALIDRLTKERPDKVFRSDKVICIWMTEQQLYHDLPPYHKTKYLAWLQSIRSG